MPLWHVESRGSFEDSRPSRQLVGHVRMVPRCGGGVGRHAPSFSRWALLAICACSRLAGGHRAAHLGEAAADRPHRPFSDKRADNIVEPRSSPGVEDRPRWGRFNGRRPDPADRGIAGNPTRVPPAETADPCLWKRHPKQESRRWTTYTREEWTPRRGARPPADGMDATARDQISQQPSPNIRAKDRTDTYSCTHTPL
jgi:hypothetical protein